MSDKAIQTSAEAFNQTIIDAVDEHPDITIVSE